ncbi:hemerythrin domain-containing protein [Dactylosporangium sp. NPDC050688]|uniref:hemerythrin domain-containing protein n=1 Tax=Dactylosporangium sp. NPDC050688 TaxID=3157217 RepID=UPI0033DE2506
MSAAPLPPLPPVPGIEDDDVDFGGRSMLDLLDEEHRQLTSLCERLIAPGEQDTAKPQDIEDVLVATLARHLSAEEQYLYPTVKAVLPDGGPIAEQEIAADAELLVALQRLHVTPAADEAYRTALDAVAAHVREHTHRTGGEVFPRLREQCTDTELVRLGNRVEIARGAAPTRPHPNTPATPPLNKLVDPAVAVVDKVRDVLTRRTTWPEDLAS